MCMQRQSLFSWRQKQQHMSQRITKPTKWHVRPAKTQISLGIRPVWSESSLCAQWVAKDPSFRYAHSEDSGQTGRMPRLIWIFAGCTCYFVGFVMRGLIFQNVDCWNCPSMLSVIKHNENAGAKWRCSETTGFLSVETCLRFLLLPYIGFNPFINSGLFYLNSIDRSVSYISGVRLVFIIVMFCRNFQT